MNTSNYQVAEVNMSGISANGKLRIGILFFGTAFFCTISSFGESPQQLIEQSVTSKKNETYDPPVGNQPPIKFPVKSEKRKAPKESVKQAHSRSSGTKLPNKSGKAHQYRNPIDMSTNQELLSMPDKPKR